MGAVFSRPNLRPTRAKLLAAMNTRMLDHCAHVLSMFGGCRSLTSVEMTDKLLTPAAAQALLDAAPGLRELRLVHADKMIWGGDDGWSGVTLPMSDKNNADAIAALALGLPLLLREHGPVLSSLECTSPHPLPITATNSLSACTRLQRLEACLEASALGSIAELVTLRSLCICLQVERLSRADLAPLSALSALTRLELSTLEQRDDSDLDALLSAPPDDISPLAGLPSLVELSLPESVLGGKELHALEPLTVLTSLRVRVLKLTSPRPHGDDRVASSRPAIAVAPLSWPLPPALRRLSIGLAEVAALAALRPPPSLTEVVLGKGRSNWWSELFFGHGNIGWDINVHKWRILPGSGTAMRGAVALLAGRLQGGPVRQLCICMPDDDVRLAGCEDDDCGHSEWLAELRPLGLQLLELQRLELGARDALALALGAPELQDLTLYNCSMLPDALPLLGRCKQLRQLSMEDLCFRELRDPEQLRCHLLALCVHAPVLQNVSIEMQDDAELEFLRENVLQWVKARLRESDVCVGIGMYEA